VSEFYEDKDIIIQLAQVIKGAEEPILALPLIKQAPPELLDVADFLYMSAMIYDDAGYGFREVADMHFKKAISLGPEHLAYRLAYADFLFRSERYKEGFTLYHTSLSFEGVPVPEWDEKEMPDADIVVYIDDRKYGGYGDIIQFSRFLPILAEKCRKVTLLTKCELVPLFRKSFKTIDVQQNGSSICAHYAVSLFKLFSILWNPPIETVPTAPYLFFELGRDSSGSGPLKVGVVWTGQSYIASNGVYNPDKRHMTIFDMVPLLGVEGAKFISLQKGDGGVDGRVLKALSINTEMISACEDFFDTAMVIQELDLIITIDSAVAHLAGAIGKPVWILLPFACCWRWLQERSDSPWYPSARLYRQKYPWGWREVIQSVKEDLESFILTSK